MAELTNQETLEEKFYVTFLDEITMKIQQTLTQNLTPMTSSHDSFSTWMGIKLKEINYALWSQVIEMYITIKDKHGYITGDTPQPKSTDLAFRK